MQKVRVVRFIKPLSVRCVCGKGHPPIAAYGAWCCPDRLYAAHLARKA
jgi:hypothetical protein